VKLTLKAAMLCMMAHCAHAQDFVAPMPPSFSIASAPGATLAQVIDTIQAHTSPSDTGEGGGADQVETFTRLWQSRVSANDTSGTNMFMQTIGRSELL
jgi:hypothetical protein